MLVNILAYLCINGARNHKELWVVFLDFNYNSVKLQTIKSLGEMKQNIKQRKVVEIL